MYNVLFLEPKLGPDEKLGSIDANLTAVLIDGAALSRPTNTVRFQRMFIESFLETLPP